VKGGRGEGRRRGESDANEHRNLSLGGSRETRPRGEEGLRSFSEREKAEREKFRFWLFRFLSKKRF